MYKIQQPVLGLLQEILFQLQSEAHDEKVLGASGQKAGSQNQLGDSLRQTLMAENHAPPEAIHLLAVKPHRTLTMFPAVVYRHLWRHSMH